MLEIKPLMQIFAVPAGGEIASAVRALIAVPVVASLRIVLRRISTWTEAEVGVYLHQRKAYVATNR